MQLTDSQNLFKKYFHIWKFATKQYKVTKSSASSEEITKVNPIDTNVNDKSPKFTCYKRLWLSIGKGMKKIIIIYKKDPYRST